MPNKFHSKSERKSGSGSGKRPERGSARVTPARIAAYETCKTIRVRKAFAQDLIAKRIDSSDLIASDKAFATKLVLGVVSTSGTLDEIIDASLRSPSDINPDVRDALRVSTYEMFYLNKSDHAAVDQGVEQVRYDAPRAAGLATAGLRKVLRSRAAVPLGDPASNVAARARFYAFPLWLTQLLDTTLGIDAASAFMEASNEDAPIFVAVNACKASSDEEVLEVFRRNKAELSPVPLGHSTVPGCYRLSDGKALEKGAVKRLLNDGKLLVSDAAAQAVAYQLVDALLQQNDVVSPVPASPADGPSATPKHTDSNNPLRILEIGAGRATKTILMQSAAARHGVAPLQITAVDNLAFKTSILEERVQRYGAMPVRALCADATDLDATLGNDQFDLVFIDAPCSGLGTLRRHVDIRWRLQEADITSLARTGLAMLLSAAKHVRPGGMLVYATCTVTSIENQGVVKAFLASNAGAEFSIGTRSGISGFNTCLTPGSSDAHFAVFMVRR